MGYDWDETEIAETETPFRVYRLDDVDMDPDTPSFLGSADDASLGEALRDLHKRGRVDEATRIGILYRPVAGAPGEWLVNPWV